MPVRDHGVRALDPVDQVPRAVRERREQAERAVHVQPGVEPLGEVGHLGQRIEVAGVHLAGARHHHGRRAVELPSAPSRSLEVRGVRQHPA